MLACIHTHPPTKQISLGLFPEPAFHSDDFLTVIAASLALFFVLAFLYPVSRYIRAVVLEKEAKIKEVRAGSGLCVLVWSWRKGPRSRRCVRGVVEWVVRLGLFVV